MQRRRRIFHQIKESRLDTLKRIFKAEIQNFALCCCEIPERQYVQSRAQDELLKIYRREHKRRFAWIRAGKISQEAFSAWSKEAQKEKEKCENGEIDQKEFTKWLKQ